MSTPLGAKTLATMPFDHLAAHLDPGDEGLEGGQGNRAAQQLLAQRLERLVQFGGVNTMQPDHPAMTIVSPSMTLARPVRQIGTPLDVKMATRRPSIRSPYGAWRLAMAIRAAREEPTGTTL
jgi:hypothetical protein